MSHHPQAVTPRSIKMGFDSSSLNSSKRMRAADDEVYLDNYHVQKRYLSEVMAISLNGLKVGDSLPEREKTALQPFDPMESPARTEGGLSKSISSFPSNMEELSTLDSLMSDDSDDSICYRAAHHIETPQRNILSDSDPITPSSSRQAQKVHTNDSNGSHAVALCCALMPTFSTPTLPVACSHSKQRPTDPENRFPPSPSDPCHSADLRRAALLRSLHMRARLPVATSFVPDDCVQLCVRSTEAEDQSSPGSLSLCVSESTPEQVEYSDAVLGSPAHGVFSGQVGRGSVRVRSLLLDECASIVPLVVPDDLSLASENISLKTERPQDDNMHSGGMNIHSGFSGSYFEVSAASEKVGTVFKR